MRIGPYRFHFYSREPSEPPHIHVRRDVHEAKFWLEPVSLASNLGYNQTELNRIESHVKDHCQKLMDAYTEFHG